MDVPQQSLKGRYSASLLGTIRSNLEGLQGYDVMALELIQNADDAGAEEIGFDVKDDGLYVWNSGTFSYCGSLDSPECPWLETTGYGCDYHRITEVASGGKLRRPENIGRFGIGFVSTYQITDHPEIYSNGFHLKLYPERAEWDLRPTKNECGTRFFLPWAIDANSEVRKKLGLSAVESGHLDKVIQDFREVLSGSLLFLRHVRKADLLHKGQLTSSCMLERPDDSEVVLTLQPGAEVQRWRIFRSDAEEDAANLREKYPQLKESSRATQIAIGIKVAPNPLKMGCLYAFLPSEQPTGLPLHLNADFFPEPDRKTMIFSGHQHQQAWNEMLVQNAAELLANNLDKLSGRLSEDDFWQILGDALDLTGPKQPDHPSCFSQFWAEIKRVGTAAQIVRAHDRKHYKPGAVVFPESPLTEAQQVAIENLGLHIISEDLRRYRNELLQLGSPLLTFERFVDHMERSPGAFLSNYSDSPDYVDKFLIPVWEVLESLFPLPTRKGARPPVSLDKLKSINFLITHKLEAIAPRDCLLVPESLSSRTVFSLLPFLAIADDRVADYSQVASLVPPLTIGCVAAVLVNEIKVNESAASVVGVQTSRLRELYSLLASLDATGADDQAAYQTLRELPIWLTGKGLVTATRAFLPGDFNDPTGKSDLLNVPTLTPISRDFVEKKLGVKTQTIDVYVKDFLPRFFLSDGPSDPAKYDALLIELARHSRLIDEPTLRTALGSLPLIPTISGRWKSPREVYYRSDRLVQLLGDANELWIDSSRLPVGLSVRTFLGNLGIRRAPSPGHLVDRMAYIAQKFPPNEATRKASAAAFYELCERFDKAKEDVEILAAIGRLSTIACFPAEEDLQSWHLSRTLHAPYRGEGFRSQARILDFRDTQRLKSEVLESLGVTNEPTTKIVVDHFLWCVEHHIEPHFYTYQILTERSAKEDPAVMELRDHPCIYVESLKTFVRPNRVYWSGQNLDRFAYILSPSLESFRAFFRTIGVKDEPSAADYAEIVLEILNDYFPRQTPVLGKDLAVYQLCLERLSASLAAESLDQKVVESLRFAPTVLNISNRLCHPDEVLNKDSEWHAGLFDGALDEALCSPVPELLPLLRLLGVGTLSDSCTVKLEFVDGDERSESDFATILNERISVIARLLHDQPSLRREFVSRAISTVSVSSYDVIRIQAELNLGGSVVLSGAKKVPAFYDPSKNSLILARPVGPRSWPHIFSAIFRQLLPNESATEISKLALILDSLMNLSAPEAHERLTDAGVPQLIESDASDEDLRSAELENLGRSSVTGYSEVGAKDSDTSEISSYSTPDETSQTLDADSARERVVSDSSVQLPSVSKISPNDGAEGRPSRGPLEVGPPADRRRSSRAKHKEEWDRRLISYVRRMTHMEPTDRDSQSVEHNLAVEAAACDAVCEYERLRGRVPEKMPRSHPGYDIVSLDPSTGKERRIEVKGRSGAWSQLGVGLTRMEFSNAQDFGEDYWLYVVEFALDERARRIYPIENPAFKVDLFMFDGDWRDVVVEEEEDPCSAFQPGARIKHEVFGRGVVQTVELRGTTRMLRVQFERGGERVVPVNLGTMWILGESDGEDNP